MGFEDILVHLDSASRSEVRLDVAAGLAQRFAARLTGLFGESAAHALSIATRDPERELAEAIADAEALFRRRTQASAFQSDWHALATVNDTELLKQTVFAARHADLTVLGQHDPELKSIGVPADFAEQIVLHSGRPVLVVPFTGDFEAIGKRIVVAWNASREAARALADAMPLLAKAERITLIAINPAKIELPYGHEHFTALIAHLAVHGIDARTERLAAGDVGAMDLLLSRLTDEAADLLVLGAHGQYGFPYLHRGGATRHILRHMTVPVLMSN